MDTLVIYYLVWRPYDYNVWKQHKILWRFKINPKNLKVFSKDGIFTVSRGNQKYFGVFTTVPAGVFLFPIL
jgi:hypothetical protein